MMDNFVSTLACVSTVYFLLPYYAFAQDAIKTTAEADVDVFLIQEADGLVTPIVIADASAKVEMGKKTSRRKQLEVEAVATVDVHELRNILPKQPGDVEKLLKTWYLYKSTAATAPLINSDAIVCTNRYCVDSCCSVKWQYSVGQDYQIISKLWGYDEQNFIYTQENINWLTADHHIMKSIVTNVMKASAQKLVAEPCADKFDLVEYLDDVAYVILAAEWNTFILFKTIDSHDSIIFVALTEEAYYRKDKTEIQQKVSQALAAHQVDESCMRTFTKSFNVQTNCIKPAKKPGS